MFFWQIWNQPQGLLRNTVGQMGFPQCLSTFLQAPPLYVWILITPSLFCFPRLRMVVLYCTYYLWLLLVFPLYFLRLLSLVFLNNFFVYSVLNWFSILLTELWKIYHYDQIDLYPYRCFPFLFICNLILYFYQWLFAYKKNVKGDNVKKSSAYKPSHEGEDNTDTDRYGLSEKTTKNTD